MNCGTTRSKASFRKSRRSAAISSNATTCVCDPRLLASVPRRLTRATTSDPVPNTTPRSRSRYQSIRAFTPVQSGFRCGSVSTGMATRQITNFLRVVQPHRTRKSYLNEVGRCEASAWPGCVFPWNRLETPKRPLGQRHEASTNGLAYRVELESNRFRQERIRWSPAHRGTTQVSRWECELDHSTSLRDT